MAKKKGGLLKGIAIAVVGVLGFCAVFTASAWAFDQVERKETTNGERKTVVGFTGLTNANGVLTYTGDYAKFNKVVLENDEDVEEDEDETEEVEDDEDGLNTVYKVKTTGEFAEVTSPLDDMFPFNQIKVVKDKYNNEFVRFPKMYMSYSYNRAGYLDGVSFANYKVDNSYFINDAWLKQDGSGEYSDYFYIGSYEASGTTDKIYSVAAAAPLVNHTREEFRTAARAYGSEKNFYNGYQQLDLPMYDVYATLCCLYYKTDDIQSVWSADVDCTKVETTGSTTPIASMNGWNTRTGSVKMLGVENMTDSAWEWCDGINFAKTSIYYQSNPNNYSDTADKTSDVIVEFERPVTSGYVELLKTGTTSKTQSIIFPAFTSATDEGYENDGYWYDENGTVLKVGGGYVDDAKGGLWTFNGNSVATHADTGTGGRLCARTLSGVKTA